LTIEPARWVFMTVATCLRRPKIQPQVGIAPTEN
jgi:hypothetical protein